ncbi:hypothetical protein B0H11DRAFT_2188936 [Mycena galericulata]|nr:hypothetical protein B0H11DRAFT_2188936 [Mycena galericulata]
MSMNTDEYGDPLWGSMVTLEQHIIQALLRPKHLASPHLEFARRGRLPNDIHHVSHRQWMPKPGKGWFEAPSIDKVLHPQLLCVNAATRRRTRKKTNLTLCVLDVALVPRAWATPCRHASEGGNASRLCQPEGQSGVSAAGRSGSWLVHCVGEGNGSPSSGDVSSHSDGELLSSCLTLVSLPSSAPVPVLPPARPLPSPPLHQSPRLGRLKLKQAQAPHAVPRPFSSSIPKPLTSQTRAPTHCQPKHAVKPKLAVKPLQPQVNLKPPCHQIFKHLSHHLKLSQLTPQARIVYLSPSFIRTTCPKALLRVEAAWLSGNQQSWSLSKSEITGPREIEGSNPGKAAFRRVLVGITNLGRVPHCSAFAVRA